MGVNTTVDLHLNRNEVNRSAQRMQTAFSGKPYRGKLSLALVRRHVEPLPSSNYTLIGLVNWTGITTIDVPLDRPLRLA